MVPVLGGSAPVLRRKAQRPECCGAARTARAGAHPEGARPWRYRPAEAHAPGRLRIEVAGLKRSPEAARALEDRLGDIDIVEHVHANPLTGRVRLTFARHVGHEDVLDRVAERLGQRREAHRPEKAARAKAPRARGCREDGGNAKPGRAPDAAAPASNWHAMTGDEVLDALESHGARGLDPAEVVRRRKVHGANRIAEAPPTSDLALVGRQFANLPVVLLMAAAAGSVLTGGVADAAVTLAVVAVNAGIGYATESGSERVIRSMTAPRYAAVPVVRAGAEQVVSQADLVPGDVLLLRPNTIVAADARLIEAAGLTVNEALLTGESEPVAKHADAQPSERVVLAERANMVHMGAFINSGTGRAVVVATGRHTEMGQIGSAAAAVKTPKTPLERDLDDLGAKLAFVSLAACSAFFITGALSGRSMAAMLKSAIALAVAAVPEGLPATATTTLALGLRELRRKGVIVRRLGAVEGLGSLEIVCFDKTGTLTENRMERAALQFGDGEALAIDDTISGGPARRRIGEISILCSEVTFERGGDDRIDAVGSSTEAALARGALADGLDPETLRAGWPLTDIRYRDQSHRFMRTVHGRKGGRRRRQLVAVKGDPYQVLERCVAVIGARGRAIQLAPAARRRITGQIDRLAGSGLRVLGFAYREAEQADDDAPQRLTWAGAAGLKDPIAPGVKNMIARLRRAGIRTIMITGDQAATAEAIAEEIGLTGDALVRVLDTRALETLAPDVLAAIVEKTDVFARVSPTAKLRIIEALQKSGKVVAMSGDGFNDASALKAADIAIAVGEESASAARDVADIIVRAGDLGALPAGVEQGRTILSNIRKSVHFIISTNLSEIIVLIAESMIAGDRLETPLELLWINLVTDVLPGLGLALEPPERGVMAGPPRPAGEPLLTLRDLQFAALESAVIAGSTLSAHGYGLARYGPGPATRTVTFLSLVAAQLTHALACRHDRFKPLGRRALFGNRHLNRALIASAGLQGLAIASPMLHRLLGIARPRPLDLAVAAGAALSAFAVNEAILAARSASPSGSLNAGRAFERGHHHPER